MNLGTDRRIADVIADYKTLNPAHYVVYKGQGAVLLINQAMKFVLPGLKRVLQESVPGLVVTGISAPDMQDICLVNFDIT